jgi:hypothetical protein
MKTILNISAVAVFLVVAPSPCFALWVTRTVPKERAKEMGMEVRSERGGRNQLRVELEFKTEGKFEAFNPESKYKRGSRVELRIGEGHIFEVDNTSLTAPLREDRSKPGRVVVSFSADRAHLDKNNLWVMVPESDGGTAYVLRVNDFVELEKDR